MHLTACVETFAPLLITYVAVFIVAPVLAIVLCLADRRCYVRRLHRMRRA